MLPLNQVQGDIPRHAELVSASIIYNPTLYNMHPAEF